MFSEPEAFRDRLSQPNWFDHHPEAPAIALVAIEFVAFVAIHFTRNEIHEWAMCVLFANFVWATWGVLRSVIRLIWPPIESKVGDATALAIYVGVAMALIALTQYHEWLGPLNYASF